MFTRNVYNRMIFILKMFTIECVSGCEKFFFPSFFFLLSRGEKKRKENEIQEYFCSSRRICEEKTEMK